MRKVRFGYEMFLSSVWPKVSMFMAVSYGGPQKEWTLLTYLLPNQKVVLGVQMLMDRFK